VTAKRLLILDDDETVGQTIAKVGESIGAEILYTADPEEFLGHVESWNPTHVALDLVMPDMDGVQVLGELARRKCTAQVIITSGSGGRVLTAAGRSAAEHGLEFAGILKKPFTRNELRSLLEKEVPRAPLGDVRHMIADAVRPADEFVWTERAFRDALDRRELRAYLQPKVDCRTLEVVGFEALARWRHPIHGLLTADKFVPQVERHGLVNELTEFMFDRSLIWFERLKTVETRSGQRIGSSKVPARKSISINISALSLAEPQFFDSLVSRCRAARVDPGDITFELTETNAMADPITSLDVLTRLRVKGFQLSIDDFGTGYSSMVQLVRLPFSEIKVDKSFVMAAMQSDEARTVIKSIVDLGRSLGLKTTAEGVDQPKTLDFLSEIGCDFAQGFYIAPPMPQEDIPTWLSSRDGMKNSNL